MKDFFERCVFLYSQDLTRLCLSLCGNMTDAEDLFQETWHKAMKNYSKYNKNQPFDKWLFSICVNTYKNSLKLSFNSRRMVFSTEEEQELFFNSIPDNSAGSPDEYGELHKIICSLPKNQRIVITLKYFKDYSLSDIAQITGVPLGTVKSRLHSAKETIRRRLNYE